MQGRRFAVENDWRSVHSFSKGVHKRILLYYDAREKLFQMYFFGIVYLDALFHQQGRPNYAPLESVLCSHTI